MKKKIILIIILVIFFLIAVAGIGSFAFYNTSLKAVGDKKDNVTFVVSNGTSSRAVIDQLYESKLIKNKFCGYIYLKLNKDIMLQAGTYELNRGMDLPKILDVINKGQVLDESISVTFIEGKRLLNYVDVIVKNFGLDKEEVLAKLSDKTYLQELIDKYWFLTDEILNDNLYYALEGYLYPDTYRFNKDATIEQIVDKMLYETGKVLSGHKDAIDNSRFTIHEMLTMASIVELESGTSEDRAGVAGVFYNRLKIGDTLGSDVTTYYAIQIEMYERDLWQHEIDAVNGYNTRSRSMAGKLPIGPICSPSKKSLVASLEPASHDYYFFVADKYGKTYFNKTVAEHVAETARLKKEGLWYTYK